MTKDYCLGSMQGGIVQPIQQQSWSLVFNSDKHHNIITGLNPYVSDDELGMFFPEYPSFQLERISAVKKGYTNENKWEGGSPYERIYQDKNVLVALYDLPDSEKYHHVDLFIPNNIAISKSDNTQSFHGIRGSGTDTYFDTTSGCVCPYSDPGWEYFRFDSTLVGVYMLTKYATYHTEAGICLRTSERTPGYVIYCESARSILPTAFEQQLCGISIARTNDKIYSKEDIGRTIDIPLKNTKQDNSDLLFKSLYLESKKGSGILTMRYKGAERVLDFNF
jgi:hypothetical protein